MIYPNFAQLNLPLDAPKPKNFFERFLQTLNGQMTEPKPFGWFHWIFITLTVATCIFIVIKCRTLTERQLRNVLLITGVVLIALEIYKQFNCAYNPDEDVWSYNWSNFPFQFCSTPLYILPLSALIPHERFRQRLYAFLGTYGLVAGVMVMLFPSSVFSETIGINLQTMIHHSGMIVVGVLLLSSGKISFNFQSLKDALFVFLPLCATAMVMNELYIAFGSDEYSFNMFYISPKGEPPMDFLVALLDHVPYIVYLIGYLFFFTFGAYLVLQIARFFDKKFPRKITEETAENDYGETNEPVQDYTI